MKLLSTLCLGVLALSTATGHVEGWAPPLVEDVCGWLQHLPDYSSIIPSDVMCNGDAIRVSEVTGGLSNRNYKVTVLGGVPSEHKSYILRVPGDLTWDRARQGSYADVHLVDREIERTCAFAANAPRDPYQVHIVSPTTFQHASPQLTSYDPTTGLMLTEWVDDGKVLTAKDFKAGLAHVGNAIRNFHDRAVLPDDLLMSRAASGRDGASSWFTPLLRAENYVKWIEKNRGRLNVEAHPELAETSDFLPSLIKAARHANKLIGQALEGFDLGMAHQTTLPLQRPVALHCDLIPANFIRGNNQEAKTLHLFDFEYCHYGHPLWDLANAVTFNNITDPMDQCRLLHGYMSGEHIEQMSPSDDQFHKRPEAPSDNAQDAPLPDGFEDGCTFFGFDEFDVRKDLIPVMRWLFQISEGLWGVVHDQVSDIPFDAAWTAEGQASFTDYGMDLLQEAKRQEPAMAQLTADHFSKGNSNADL